MKSTFGAGLGLSMIVGSLLGFGVVACGDDGDEGGGSTLSASEVAAFYGLVPGTCLVYEFGAGGAQTAFVTIEEPEDRIIPGRNDLIWRLVAPGATGDIVRYLEAGSDGRIRLLREESRPGGVLETRLFFEEGGVEPIFAQFRRAAGDTLAFAGSEFRTSSARPTEIVSEGTTDEDPPLEQHVWNVTDDDVSVGLEPDFDSTFQLSYRITRNEEPGASVWNFVPQVGFVRFQDFTEAFGGTGNVYLLSESRICQPDGTCEGSPSRCPAL